MKNFILYIFLFISLTTWAADIYVSSSGSGTACTLGSPCSITYAAANASAGDVVHVIAGNYSGLRINITVSGTSGNPIKFIGYTSTINDITATTGPTYTYADLLSDSQELPDNIMPHFEGTEGVNPTNIDPAIDIQGDYVELHNFMVSKYRNGVRHSGSHLVIDNVVVHKVGNWDPSAGCWNQASYVGCDNATGKGIFCEDADNAEHITVKNSIVLDAGFSSFFPVGVDHLTYENSKAYTINPGNGSDYLFDLFNVTYGSITNCEAWRIYKDGGVTGHQSRGLAMQADTRYVEVDGFYSDGTRIELENSRNNTFLNIEVNGGVNYFRQGGIWLSGQSDDNLFKNIFLKGEGLHFYQDGASNEYQVTPWTGAGSDNYFINLIITGMPNVAGNLAAVNFHWITNYSDAGAVGYLKDAGVNYIINATIHNVPRLVGANRPGSIYFYNSTISDVFVDLDGTYSSYPDYRNSYNAYFTNCNFYNNTGFTTPDCTNCTNTNSTTYNPEFTNAATLDFTLQGTSNLIDAGMDGSTINANADTDFFGNPRGANGADDIGVDEEGSDPEPEPEPEPYSIPKSKLTKKRFTKIGL